ncbi:MAG: glycosyltransferase family 39 protein [Lachnospiraceae bacterium]|nr:glycosyltransferase family 39 protein [Lachnospiraceae bacterium]
MQESKIINKENLILFFSALLGSLIYISLIFNNNLWVDEAFTASLIRGNLSEVWAATAADTLPPFYNFFTKFITMMIGYSAPAMKFSSALAAVSVLFYGSFNIKKIFSFRESLIFTAFFLTMPYFYYYAVEIRPYSWGLFFSFASALAFSEIIKFRNLSAFIKFAVFSALSGYAHHFALVATAVFWFFLFLYLLIRRSKEIKCFFLSAAVFIILYLPCLILAVYQIKNASSYFSMSPLNFKSFLSDIRFPFVTHYTPLSLLLMIIFLFVFINAFIGFIRKDFQLYCPLVFSITPFCVLLFGYAVSFAAGSSFFTSRYLVPSLAVFWLGVSLSADYTFKNLSGIYKKVFVIFTAVTILVSGIINYRSQFISEYDNSVNDMTAWFDENLSPDDGYIIYETAYQIELCMRYYYPDLKKYDRSNFEEIKGNIWYFEVDGFEYELDKFKEMGYNIVYIKTMSFDRYSFKLYQLQKNKSSI